MNKVNTLGASSRHVHCKNYEFQADTPLKVFNRDEVFEEITWIDLKGCSGILDSMTFKNLPNLETIGLDDCNIDQINANTFSVLLNFKSIEIKKSTFPLDENTFKNCTKVYIIRLIQVENIIIQQNIFNDLINLQYLLIDNTTLKLGNNFFSGNKNLEFLIIQHCNVEEFSEEVFQPVINLKTLYFHGNTLQSFPGSSVFLCLKTLIILGLYDNSIPSKSTQIDYHIFKDLPNLNTVNFPEDIIKTLNFDEFEQIKHIQFAAGIPEDDMLEFLRDQN